MKNALSVNLNPVAAEILARKEEKEKNELKSLIKLIEISESKPKIPSPTRRVRLKKKRNSVQSVSPVFSSPQRTSYPGSEYFYNFLYPL